MNIDEERIDEGRQHGERRLLANGGALGLLGASQAYQQVWARDSMICGLGLLLCRDAEGAAIHRRSLETLRRFQSPLGKIPHNVGFTHVHDPALVAHGSKLEMKGNRAWRSRTRLMRAAWMATCGTSSVTTPPCSRS